MFKYSITYAMIRFSVCMFLNVQVFVFLKSNPLIGEYVYTVKSCEFPFIVSFRTKISEQLNYENFCTGSFITQQHIITAAHCFEDKIENSIEAIVAGEDWTTSYFSFAIDSWLIYDSWARHNKKPIEFPVNDVAIVKLLSPANKKRIIPISLTYLNDQPLYRTKASIFGWNFIKENPFTMVLRKGYVRILTPDHCQHQFKLVTNQKFVMNKNFLTTFAEPYVLASCGDSGGPLLDANNNLIGITRSTCPNRSWGNFSLEFLNRYQFNVHSSVNYYREFIENVITSTEK
ncbi:brain-specific serine protease 4-like [Phymastichus coffea]|uniref:brain-specific serine protease 4-like n=1 Tax=Phymastichus coffea TaxID=108790 RepID=UPI00273BD2B8|nr:brain-specific serine protease 4-like [Phymastichus coffea]